MKPVVLYVGGFFLPDKNAAAHRVLANGKILEQLGYEVHYLGVNYESKLQTGQYQRLSDTQAEIGYPKALFEWCTFLGNIDYILHYIKKELKKQPTAIFAYNYPAVGLWKLRNYCKKSNIRLIADCTEWYQPTGNILFRLIKGFDTTLRMRFVQPKLDGMIAISRYLYDYYNSRMGNVVLIPPLKDADEGKFRRDDECFTPNKLSFVYAGSPGDVKDKLSLLIKPLAKLSEKFPREFCFDIIGITEEQFRAKYQAEIPDNLRGKLSFLGRVSHQEAVEKIKRASFSVFLREDNLVTRAGFPTKFAEAITCGTPVLTNASSNITDFLYDGENGFLLDISSGEALEQSLGKAFVSDDECISKMKQRCYASRLFHYENYTKQIQQLLK